MGHDQSRIKCYIPVEEKGVFHMPVDLCIKANFIHKGKNGLICYAV